MILLSRSDVLDFSKGQVTSWNLFLHNGTPDPNGVFSEEIFGKTPKEKKENFGHIELNCRVFHPHIYRMLKAAYRKEFDIAYDLKPYTFDKNGKIIEILEDDINKYKDVYYGFIGLIVNLHRLQKKETKTAQEFWKVIDKYGLSKCVIDVIPVIPVAYRPYRDQYQYDDMNNVYSSLLKSSEIISNMESSSKSERYALSHNYVQKYIYELYQYVESKVAKKTGAVRGNLLGKRVDFSARSVATVDPNIKPDEVGLPFKIAIQLFEPWILRELVQETNLPIPEALEIIQRLSKGFKVDKKYYNIVDKIVNNISSKRYVIVKRDPNLHRGSIKAFKVKIVYDDTIHTSPNTNESFNLDYDGDQIAVFTPITEEALQEVKKLTNFHASANPRNYMINFSKEIAAGICMLTMDPIDNPRFKDYWWWKKTKYNGFNTTQGRVAIFNLLPESIKSKINFDTIFNKRIKMENIIEELININATQDEIIDFSHKVQKLSNDVITEASESLDLEDFEISEKVKPLIDSLDKIKDPLKQQEKLNEIQKYVISELEKRDVQVLIKCGAFKTGQLAQLLGSKGLILDPNGELVLIKTNFSNGLKPTEYFTAGYGARNGIIFRANKTAVTGYLKRKIEYGLMSVDLDPNLDFCGTTKTLKLTPDQDMIKRLINRYIIHDGELKKITIRNKDQFIGEEIDLYSPMYCKSKKICRRCFGDDYNLIKTKRIGIIAAQTIGERLTQEMLKAFHVGGVVKPEILDFIENIKQNTGMDLSKCIDKKNNDYFAKTDLVLYFSKSEYNFKPFFNDMEPRIPLELIIGDLECDSKIYKLAFDGSIYVYLPHQIETDKERYILRYIKGQQVFQVIPEVNDMLTLSKKILNTVEGRSLVKDEYHLLSRLYTYMKDMGDFTLVWLEILVSQLFRCKDKPNLPARLCDGPSMLVSIKHLPYLESAIRGFAFENFGKSITNGLVTDNEDQMESVIDQLIL